MTFLAGFDSVGLGQVLAGDVSAHAAHDRQFAAYGALVDAEAFGAFGLGLAVEVRGRDRDLPPREALQQLELGKAGFSSYMVLDPTKDASVRRKNICFHVKQERFMRGA